MNDKEMQDKIAAMRAEMDQAKAATGELASSMGCYFQDLLANGFERAEAFELTFAFQDWFLHREAETPAPTENDDD